MRTTWKEKIPVSQTETLAEEPAASQEVITHTQAMPQVGTEAPAPSDQFSQLIAIIERLIANPELDLDRVERMLGMAEKVADKQAEMAYTSAFAMAQLEMPVIDEDGAIKNKAGEVQSTYAYYEDIMEAVTPIISKYGLTLNFPKIDTTDTHVCVRASLKHVRGFKEVLDMNLPLDDAFGKNLIQRYKSSHTYAKRIAAIAILNITTRKARKDDDDGVGTKDSAEFSQAISEIDMFMTLDEGLEWKNGRAIEVRKAVSVDEDKRVVYAWNNKMKRLSEAAYGENTNG